MNEYSPMILQGPINIWIISFEVGQLYAVFDGMNFNLIMEIFRSVLKGIYHHFMLKSLFWSVVPTWTSTLEIIFVLPILKNLVFILISQFQT